MLIKNRDNPVRVCWLTVFAQSQTVKGNSVVMFFLFLCYVFIATNCVSIKRKLHCQHQATYRHQVTNPMTVCSRTTGRSNGNRSTAFPGAFSLSSMWSGFIWTLTPYIHYHKRTEAEGNTVDGPSPKICGAYLSKPALLPQLNISLLERHLNWTAQLIHLLSGCCRLKKIKSCLILLWLVRRLLAE